MQNDVNEILSRHKLTATNYIRKPDGGMIRAYVIECVDEEGKKYCLKVFSSHDVEARKRFENEASYIKALRSSLSAKYKSHMPLLYKYSLKGDHPYYIYRFIEGQNLSKFIEDYGIKFGNFHADNFEAFIEFMWQITQTKVDDIDQKISTWRTRNAQKEMKYYMESDNTLLPSHLYDQIKSFYEEYHEKVFAKSVLSHRDLYPENIIIEKPGSKNFTVLDWEYFSKVPLGFDAAFLTLMFWREEFWKAKVFAYYYNKYEALGNKKDLQLFLDSYSFCIVILSLRFLYQINTFVDESKSDEDLFHAKRSFIYDLESALRGDIIRPRNIKFYLNINDLNKVAVKYELGKVKEYEIFYASKGNTVAKVLTPKGSFIFRFYSSSRSRRLISRELKIFDKLRESGVRTYDVLKTTNGKSLLECKLYERRRHVAVLSYITGKKIEKEFATKTSTENLATTLRKIHDSNIVHGDYSKENVLFLKDKISGVIDFEWGRMTKSSKMKEHDLAKAIALWLTDIRQKNLPDNEFVEIFLKAYFKDKPLSIKKKSKLLYLIISKINTERDIFTTTLDMQSGKKKVSRFRKAEESILSLIPAN